MLKKSIKIGAFLLLTLFVYKLILGDNGLLDLLRLKKEVAAQHEKSEAVKAHMDSVKKIVKTLQTDSIYLEKIARKELGVAKPGERVFHFVSDSSVEQSQKPMER